MPKKTAELIWPYKNTVHLPCYLWYHPMHLKYLTISQHDSKDQYYLFQSEIIPITILLYHEDLLHLITLVFQRCRQKTLLFTGFLILRMSIVLLYLFIVSTSIKFSSKINMSALISNLLAIHFLLPALTPSKRTIIVYHTRLNLNV